MARAETPAATLRVRVTPRAARDEIVGWREGALRVRVTAPPVDGAANRAVAALLARTLGVTPSAVAVVGGERGRDKRLRIVGLGEAAIKSRLPGEEP